MTPALPTVADLFIACLRAGGYLYAPRRVAWQCISEDVIGCWYVLYNKTTDRSSWFTSEAEFLSACEVAAPLSEWRVQCYTPRYGQVQEHAALRATCPRLFQLQEAQP